MTAKISIITIVKDHPDGLRRTAESVLAQGEAALREVEWLVVNGSVPNDPTHDVLAQYQDRVAWSQSLPDKGLYDAMNIGIDHATGDYLWFMNAGDTVADTDTVAGLLQTIDRHPDADFLYGDFRHDGRLQMAGAIDRNHLRMITSHQAMLFRREIVGTLRYSLKYPIASDYKFIIQFLKKGTRRVYLERPLADFEGGGLSERAYIRGAREAFRIRRKHTRIGFFVNLFETARSIAEGMAHSVWLGLATESRPSADD